MSKNIRNKGKSLLLFPDNYTIIDIETTGFDPKFDEIIEIAAIKIRNNQVEETFQKLVKSNEIISDFISNLTGITNEILANAESLNTVLNDFYNFVGNDIIVAHNVHFDLNFLYDNILYVLKKEFSNDFVDTLRLSRRLFKDLKTHRLKSLSIEFGLISPSHRAMPDCKTVYELINYMKKHMVEYSINFDEWIKNSRQKYFNIFSVLTAKTEFDEENLAYKKHFVFTGKLESLIRKDATQLVVDLGGTAGNSVTLYTNYLVLGNFDYSNIKGSKSSKLLRAEKLITDGQELEIISENVFLDLIND